MLQKTTMFKGTVSNNVLNTHTNELLLSYCICVNTIVKKKNQKIAAYLKHCDLTICSFKNATNRGIYLKKGLGAKF